MEKEKLKKILTKAVDFEQGKEIALARELISLDEKIDAGFSEANTKIENTKSELESKIENIQLLKGETGEKGADGIDGKDYILTDSDKNEIASKIEVPIVEKVIEKTETIIEKPIVTEIIKNEIKEVAKYETADEVTEKVNKGKPLIKRERVEGLADLEYNLKHNLYTGISETRALELIRTGVDLTGYVPYTGATQDLNLGHFYLQADGFKANDSAGAYIKSNNGTNVALFGAGGGANWTFYDGVNYDSATANTLAYFGGSKTLSSVTLDSSLVLSTGVLAVNTSYDFTWQNDHLWRAMSVKIEGADTDLTNGLNLYNSASNTRPYLRFSDNSQEFYVGFKAPDDFSANSPQILWALPDIDSAGVWKSDGAGYLSISPVSLTSDITGVLPYANGGTNSSTAFTAGSVIFAGASGFEQDNTNFRWDNTNKRLGIGVTPSYGLHVSKSDTIPAYFNGSGASTRLAINNGSNTGIGLYIGGALKWSIASVNGGGGGTNPDLALYNDQTSVNTLWLDGNNNNVSVNGIPSVTTNKFTVNSTYSTSASRIAYFVGTSGTSGLEVRTNGQAQYMARSSTHANTELRFQAFSDGNTYFGTATLSGTLNANLYIRTSADSGTNTGSIFMTLMGTQKVAVTSTGVGISNGALTPSSLLTLGAGTATAGTAPLRFTSGTLLTTPVAGAVEFLTDAFYATITTGAARKTFAFLEAPVFTTSIQTPTIELGHATDTTLTRVSAGIVAIEGTNILKNHTPPFIGNNSAAPNSAANVGSSNRAWYKAINVDNYVTVTGIRIGVAATSGNIDVGLYDSGGNKLASSGSVACPTANTKVTVAFTASVDIAPGTYYLAIVADNTTATFVRAGTDTIMGLGYEDTAFPLPSSASLSYMSIAGADRSFAILGVVSGGLSS